MAALIIIAKNQTTSPVVLVDLGLTIPASGQITLTDSLTTVEIQGDRQIQDLVSVGTVVLNDGTSDLPASAAVSVGHGVQTDPTLHSPATANGAGFMPAADKAKVDAYPATPSGIDHNTLANLGAGNPHGQYQQLSEKGVAGGYASLDGSGRIPAAQLTISAYQHQGNWDALTNAPVLASGVGTQGDRYRVSVAGTTNLDGETGWTVGDYVVFNGTTWEREDNSGAVDSVNGQQGAVVLTPVDIGADAAGTARPPIAHATSHEATGSDPISADDLGSAYVPTNYTPSSQTVGGQLAGIDAVLTGGGGADVFSGYDSVGGTPVDLAPVTVPLGARHKTSSSFSHTIGSGEVTIDVAGTYIVDADVSTDNDASSSRSVAQFWVERDAGAGFVEVPGSRAWTYHRTSSAGENTAGIAIGLDLSVGDVIRVRVQRIAGSAIMHLRASGSRLRIFSPRGPAGPAGPPGSAGVNVHDEGAPVAGSQPKTTVNFVGPGVSVSGAGADATVTVAGTVFGTQAQDSEDEGSVGTSDSDPSGLVVLTLTTPSLPNGRYRIGWSAELISPFYTTGCGFIVRNATTSQDYANSRELTSVFGGMEKGTTGFRYVALSGVNTIEMRIYRSGGFNTVTARRRRLEIWRVS